MHGPDVDATCAPFDTAAQGAGAARRNKVDARNPLEQLSVLERDVEVLACDARVLARDRVRARSFTSADRVDEARGAGVG